MLPIPIMLKITPVQSTQTLAKCNSSADVVTFLHKIKYANCSGYSWPKALSQAAIVHQRSLLKISRHLCFIFC